jgi:hypothetical protein
MRGHSVVVDVENRGGITPTGELRHSVVKAGSGVTEYATGSLRVKFRVRAKVQVTRSR